MSREIVWTSKFKKEYKLAMKRNMDIAMLDNVIRILASGDPLPEKYCDHPLSGIWKGFRECHISLIGC